MQRGEDPILNLWYGNGEGRRFPRRFTVDSPFSAPVASSARPPSYRPIPTIRLSASAWSFGSRSGNFSAPTACECDRG